MFVPGSKVTAGDWGRAEYTQLTAPDYTVLFSYMTDSFTWVVLEEFPDLKFNDNAFDGQKGAPFYAVKTTQGGFLITDIKYMPRLVPDSEVLGFKEMPNYDDMWKYFAGCAVCGIRIDFSLPEQGILKSGDMVALPVCPICRLSSPGLNIHILKRRTQDEVGIDWWVELDLYGEETGNPNLCDEIQQEIDAYCDACEGTVERPDCSPGDCPYYLVEDYLALKHMDIYRAIKQKAEARMRQQYVDSPEAMRKMAD